MSASGEGAGGQGRERGAGPKLVPCSAEIKAGVGWGRGGLIP